MNITIKPVVPELDNAELIRVMKKVFEQYDICKRLPSSPERDEYVKSIEDAVGKLADNEKKLITERYMIDSYRFDYQVYNFNLQISKDTYTKRRNRAFAQLYITLVDTGILEILWVKEE